MTSPRNEQEQKIVSFWQEKDIFNKVQHKNTSGKSFRFVDGPPYPTGEAHLGHLRNWAIKDAVLRFKRFQGFDVYSRDGYDVHGLPVEQKVQKKLGIKDTKDLKDNFGVENFIKECRDYVSEIMGDMRGVRERYGLWFDRDHWQTSHPQYISFSWRFFKKAQEKNMLYKDFKCVAWSPALETTLSDYEVKDSYAELEDPSIYARFKVRKEFTTTGKEEYLLIWTTTPWTLEANQAIAVNKNFNYAKVLVQDDRGEYVLIVGEPLVEQVIATISKTQKMQSHKVLEVIEGHQLVGIRYEPLHDDNPTQQELAKTATNHKVVHADFVSLGEGESVLDRLEKKSYKHEGPDTTEAKQKKVIKEGTGLAHEAPAHGMEDFDLCRSEGIKEAYCVVDERGLMIPESKWSGINFRDANAKIIDHLVEKRKILHADWKVHTYPLCWRSKVPIVYRTTEQWYIKRGDYTQDIIKENKNVQWTPEFAQTSFDNLMEGAGDWAISRQRFWGIPIPIFEDDQGQEYDVFGSKEELEATIGHKLDDIHLDNLSPLSYQKNGKTFKHVGYTTDVWFDSGSASFASYYKENIPFEEVLEKYYPITWVTESEDQIRGWFSSLFNVGYLLTGKAPYNNVLYYKFVMAKDGQKMSKSLGNGISGNEAIETWGSDITRYYLLTKRPPEDQVNFDPDEIPTVQGFFNTFENVFKLLHNYLEEYPIKHISYTLSALPVEDQWILYKLNTTLRSFERMMGKYELNLAFKELEEFVVRDFSKTYLKLVKERLDERDENLLCVLNTVLKTSLLMLAPASPFISETLYQNTTLVNKKESLFLEHFPEVEEMIIKEVERSNIHENFNLAQEIIQSILNAREKAKIGVRWPLGRVDLGSSLPSLQQRLEAFEPLIKKLTNVHKIAYSLDDVDLDYSVKPNFAGLKKDFENPGNIIKAINLAKFHIVEDLKAGKKGGVYEGVDLDFEKHLIKEIILTSDLVSSEFSTGTVILETTQDEILLEEGYLRELFRRVQDMRKAQGLSKDQRISLSFEGSDEYFVDLVSNTETMIKKKVGAEDILQHTLNHREEFEIKDKKLVVSLDVLED